jgi:hypothetical protein
VLLLSIGAALSVLPARADEILVFDVNASILNGPFEGTDAITGTLDVDVTTGAVTSADISVDGVANPFTGILGGVCTSACVTIFNSGFADFGVLALGPTVGYDGGDLIPSSNPPSAIRDTSYMDLNSVAYAVSGTVTPAFAGTISETYSQGVPEPNLGLLTACLCGLLVVPSRLRLASRVRLGRSSR